MPAAQSDAGLTTALRMRISSFRIAIAATHVVRVARMPQLTRMPHAPPELLGVTSIQGQVLPVVTIDSLLSGPSERTSPLIVELDLGFPIGIAVDEIEGMEMVHVRENQMEVWRQDAARSIDLAGWLSEKFLLRTEKRRRASSSPAKPDAVEADERAPHLVFMLADQRFALHVRHVRELVDVSVDAAGSDDLGTLALRDRLVPMVALDRLLGLSGRSREARRPLIVTDIGGALVGLVVDRLVSIERWRADEIGPVPAVLNRGGGTARIEAMASPANGGGIVSILAPERLFSEAETARILSAEKIGEALVSEARQVGAERILIFTLGEEAYGLPLSAVDEVIRLPDQLTRVPNAPPFVEGIINLRGSVIPIIDQSRRFEAARSPGVQRRILITHIGDMRVGFIVDHASEILALTAEQLSPAPQLAGEEPMVFERVARIGERLILIVEPSALLAKVERDLLRDLSMARRPA